MSQSTFAPVEIKYSKELLEVGSKYEGPIYVYVADRIRERCKNLISSFSTFDSSIHYAIKANANREVLAIIRESGLGAETVSLGEVERSLECGFKPEQIIFTQAALSKKELQQVIDKNIIINLDSLNQLKWFGEFKPGASCRIRVNLDVGDGHHAHVVTGGALSKFGIHKDELKEALEIASTFNLTIEGIHQHIGSFILDEHMFVGAMNALLEVAEEITTVKHVDFGGGFGVPYEPHQRELDVERLGVIIKERMDSFKEKTGRSLHALFEPGRYPVADAGVLLARVTDIKHHSHTMWVGINTGFNHLVRPMMYGAYHPIVNVTNENGKAIPSTIYGNICESGDVFARDRMMAESTIGDIVAITHAGAYGYMMASEYNLREKPSEIVI